MPRTWIISMAGRSHPYGIILLAWLVCAILFPSSLWGQQKSREMPPASVSVAKVTSGQVVPQNEFIATIFYQEISDTASEISGLVGTVHFEEGQRVKKGQILVELGSDILRKRLQATTASFEEILSELEIARIDLRRRDKLYKKKSISKQSYDENKFRVIGLEKRAASLKAEIERLREERRKLEEMRAEFDEHLRELRRAKDKEEFDAFMKSYKANTSSSADEAPKKAKKKSVPDV